MRTNFLTVAVALWIMADPSLLHGQVGGASSGPTTNDPGKTKNGRRRNNAGTNIAAELTASKLANPAALFLQLDTNKDGALTREEFARLGSMLTEPPAQSTR